MSDEQIKLTPAPENEVYVRNLIRLLLEYTEKVRLLKQDYKILLAKIRVPDTRVASLPLPWSTFAKHATDIDREFVFKVARLRFSLEELARQASGCIESLRLDPATKLELGLRLAEYEVELEPFTSDTGPVGPNGLPPAGARPAQVAGWPR